ncbi:50S ribosomal protein L10 [Candidatus Woesearchaeota archaeon]|nr:50S ribosomal protein L10 [Candidatus Woesearchaeota archaeon]
MSDAEIKAEGEAKPVAGESKAGAEGKKAKAPAKPKAPAKTEPAKPAFDAKGKAHVSDAKKKLVKDLAALIDKNEIIGIVNMENLPARQLNNMRHQLRGKVLILMTKKRFIRLALEQSKKHNIKELEQYIKGMPALLFTSENPFSMFKLLKKSKSNAPIKAGQKAPRDIVVAAGPTNFAPGPVIGELGSFRIKTGIEGGKVAIKEDATVAKEGAVVNDKLAALLTRLGIEPMEIGLDLIAVYENGNIITSKVLDIDEEEYASNVRLAASEAFNLAMFIELPLKDTINALLSKAHKEAYALAKEGNIITSETVKEKLAQAEAEANALKSLSGA